MINKIGKIVTESANQYGVKLKPIMDDLKFKEQYQGRIIDCMVGEVDDNYIETPETNNPIIKLEHSKEGIVKIPIIKGKTILVDADGNETDTPGEGCKLVSVGEKEDNKLIILSKNKNLFDSEIEKHFIHPSNGQNISWSEYWRTKGYIPCKPKTAYSSYFDYKGVTIGSCMFFYNKNKEYISMTWGNPHKTPSDCCFIRIAGQSETVIGTSIDITQVKNIRLYENDNSQTYIEPKSHKIEIPLNEPLRSLPNGVYDEIIGNKKIIRLEKQKVTEDIRFSLNTGWENDEFLAVYFGATGKARAERTHFSSNIFKSMRFSECSINGVVVKECVRTDSQAFYIFIKKSRLETPNIEGFVKWLSENPMEIIYELAEPIIEQLPNGIVLQGFDDTTMYIENSITPTVQYGYNALIPYKQELSNQKEEVETNALDIEQNIIPYLMDMEFNLMLMEDNE